MEVVALEDVTPKNELVATPEDSAALRATGSNSRRFKFSSQVHTSGGWFTRFYMLLHVMWCF